MSMEVKQEAAENRQSFQFENPISETSFSEGFRETQVIESEELLQELSERVFSDLKSCDPAAYRLANEISELPERGHRQFSTYDAMVLAQMAEEYPQEYSIARKFMAVPARGKNQFSATEISLIAEVAVRNPQRLEVMEALLHIPARGDKQFSAYDLLDLSELAVTNPYAYKRAEELLADPNLDGNQILMEIGE